MTGQATKLREPLNQELSNSAGIDDCFTCPACYEDHDGYFAGETLHCDCGHSFHCTLKYEPVCCTELVDKEDMHG